MPPVEEIVLESAAGPEVTVDGQTLIFLGGTNYLGLNTHPELRKALRDGVARWGISSSGSRTTTGTAAPHLELEARVRGLLDVESAVLVSSAYLGNALVVQSLLDTTDAVDAIVVDELAHPSMKDAAALSGGAHKLFRHHDLDHLLDVVSEYSVEGRRVLICADAVSPTSGELVPLDDERAIADRFGATLLIDDAHGFGVLGKNGRGTPEHFGIPHRELFVSATFSKALGCFGGVVAGKATLEDRRDACGAYVGTTPLPPAIANAVLKALDLAPAQRQRLRQNVATLKDGLRSLGLEFPDSPMPLARFVVGDRETNTRVYKELRERGVLIPFIDYPGGPEGGVFRLAVTAAHTDEHIERSLEALRGVL